MLAKRLLPLTLTCAAALAATACATATPPAPGQRGSVISTTQVAELSAEQVRAQLTAAKIDHAQVRYGVTAHRVVYRTVGVRGEPTTASQLIALPRNDHSDLGVVSWLHGTTVYRGDVASVKPESTDRAAALLFAATGRAVSAPDYLGLGEGPGHHPYGHPQATVSAALDALRAAREVAGKQGRTFDERLRISGFSQGGPATMLLGRAVQEGADPAFTLDALAPVGGPFELSRFEADAARDEVDKAALYLAYFGTAWHRMYGLYDSPRQAFREPYADRVETLFDGDHRTQEIAAALPPKAKDLFTEDFLAKIRNPAGPFRDQLRAMDTTCDWRPAVPVEIFHAAGDRDVAFAHARQCAGQLAGKGAAHTVTDVGAVDHNGSVRAALPRIAAKFAPAS
ncbi:lipase [Crossiella sp. SN42]|uniref:lipase family protein n=1 Tax=Crossiella sp. SN42 TaxID=2944808 RepID=UPI00207C4CEF|nr:lipase family protein [Crossiella sp. SN42]MCO1581725.1 lipase [Crossiella sp. SN42]